MLLRCGLAHPTVMFKKQDFFTIGGYNTSLIYCEDLDLWLRYLKAGFKIKNIRQTLLKYRKSKRNFVHWKYMIFVRIIHLGRIIRLRK